ncbi:MAG: phosphatase PAP2 family protein [Ilumatobacteraceae bacterium]
MSEQSERPTTKVRSALPWLKEAIVIGAVYIVYGLVRNQFGSAKLNVGDEPRHAFNNAVAIIDIEEATGLFHEQTIQRWFLDTPWIPFFNIFYGTAHFAVTLGVLIWLFVRHRAPFGRWRSTLVATTVIGLIGFALFPLMPPRLFNAEPHECRQRPDTEVCNVYRYGGAELARETNQPDYEFVDTLREVGGLWSFDSKELDSVSNQYAAMPSLHIGWSVWCAIVLWQFAQRRSSRWLGVIYPFVTLTAIVATANHFIIDAAGALLVLGAGYGLARLFERLHTPRPIDVVEHPAEDVLVSN